MVSTHYTRGWASHLDGLPPPLAGWDPRLLQGIRFTVRDDSLCAWTVTGPISGHVPVPVRVNGQCPRCPDDRFCPSCRKEIERSLRRLRSSRRCVLIIFWSRLGEEIPGASAGTFIGNLLTNLKVRQAVWLGPGCLKRFLDLPHLSLLSPTEIGSPLWAGQARSRPGS